MRFIRFVFGKANLATLILFIVFILSVGLAYFATHRDTNLSAQQFSSKGLKALEKNDYIAALNYYQKAFDKSSDPSAQKASLAYSIAQVYAGEDKPKKTIEWTKKAIDIYARIKNKTAEQKHQEEFIKNDYTNLSQLIPSTNPAATNQNKGAPDNAL